MDSKEPVLILACKADGPEAKQDYLLQPASFCLRHKLPPPHPFSASQVPPERDIYVKLATMAAFP